MCRTFSVAPRPQRILCPGGALLAVLQFGSHRDRRRRERDLGVRVVLLLAPGRRHLGAGHRAAGRIVGGLVVADPAGTFVYADSSGNAFTFGAGATSFGTGSASRGSLADLKIAPGLAVMLAAGAVSAEAVS